MDHDVVLAVNEVTVLMVIAGIGIAGLIGTFIAVSVQAILRGNSHNPKRIRA